ncbi:hypothetical protein R1sor_025626 [Riccia sorocarpa]|uniref:H15 domain-containing protein n=1 Tax=Riccia sorocarpa TaxID=122646 RepID=A0ABD3G960_9MARC
MARRPLKVIINSAGKRPHATLRQLILNAILKLKKRGGCTKTDIRRNIERYYNCKLGKKFLGQMGRSLSRLVKEAQLHNHYERYQIVPIRDEDDPARGEEDRDGDVDLGVQQKEDPRVDRGRQQL